ncbi:MAG: hypothetical protein K6G22_03320 [Lachnospiraceae bacterium]|nr:hypothetical protein [Lachnospiraceae bacterium]
MFSAICFILFLVVFFKLFGIAFRVGWGIFKIALFLVFFPMIVPMMIFAGLAAMALPIILIAGIIGFAHRAV